MDSNQNEFAVGWFTLALINAGLAQSKGRSRLRWWFASLFFGPICTFLVVIWEPLKPPTQ
ncbi:MAG TPA: hypothetical protein VG759_02625 [Candidatus Angelobacter sp.]|jgi:hypothetical protein|nr:hypothetical protein [Candidatus Angelobacter sp.]